MLDQRPASLQQVLQFFEGETRVDMRVAVGQAHPRVHQPSSVSVRLPVILRLRSKRSFVWGQIGHQLRVLPLDSLDHHRTGRTDHRPPLSVLPQNLVLLGNQLVAQDSVVYGLEPSPVAGIHNLLLRVRIEVGSRLDGQNQYRVTRFQQRHRAFHITYRSNRTVWAL